MSLIKTQTPGYQRQDPKKPSAPTRWLPDWIACLLQTPTPQYRTAPLHNTRERTEP